MFDYIQKFSALPPEIREKISNPSVTARIEELEERYGVDLVKTVMRVATGDIPLDYIGLFFMDEEGLPADKADGLVQALYSSVFSEIAEHLGIPDNPPAAGESAGSVSAGPEGVATSEQTAEKPAGISAAGTSPYSAAEPVLKDAQVGSGLETSIAPELKPIGINIPIRIAAPPASFSAPPITSASTAPVPSAPPVATMTIEMPQIAPPAPPKPAVPAVMPNIGPNSGLLYHEEDEQEIKDHIEQMQNKGISPDLRKKESVAVDSLISASHITFSSKEAENRFRQILATYVRGVRKRFDAKNALMKPFAYGGVELDEKTAEESIAYTEKNSDLQSISRQFSHEEKSPLANIEPLPEEGAGTAPNENKPDSTESGIEKLNKIVAQGERDIPYDLRSALAEKTDQQPADTGRSSFVPQVAAPVQIPVKLAQDNAVTDAEKAVVVEALQVAGVSIRRNIESGRKKRMDDVTFTPKVMGPIDELRAYDPLTFRRLGPDPAKAAAKIREKIDLLGEEQYAKRIEGINAWRISPVNKLYLAIGERSMAEGKSVEQVISEMKAAGQDALEPQEFEAIMDLNRTLRF